MDTGLTNGQAYFYKVSAVNGSGESAQSNEASATPNPTLTQLIGNPGFENGSTNPAPWVATSGVIGSPAGEPPHSGSWDAWLDGYGTTHTDTLSQQVTIPSNISTANLGFWLHIDTAETSTTTAYDTLQVQVRNPSGTVLGTLATYSNLNGPRATPRRPSTSAPTRARPSRSTCSGRRTRRSRHRSSWTTSHSTSSNPSVRGIYGSEGLTGVAALGPRDRPPAGWTATRPVARR